MISSFIIIGVLFTGCITIIDNQDMEYEWIESCYGIECTDPYPYYQDDGISYWGFHSNI